MQKSKDAAPDLGVAGRQPVGQAKPGDISHHVLYDNNVITDVYMMFELLQINLYCIVMY